MTEDMVRELALWAAAAIAALWGGGKIPWRSLLSKLKPAVVPKQEDQVVKPDDDMSWLDKASPEYSVHWAIYTLRKNAPDKEFQKLVDAVDSDFWQKNGATK